MGDGSKLFKIGNICHRDKAKATSYSGLRHRHNYKVMQTYTHLNFCFQMNVVHLKVITLRVSALIPTIIPFIKPHLNLPFWNFYEKIKTLVKTLPLIVNFIHMALFDF
jgi:hypothetical protein